MLSLDASDVVEGGGGGSEWRPQNFPLKWVAHRCSCLHYDYGISVDQEEIMLTIVSYVRPRNSLSFLESVIQHSAVV